MPLTSDEIDVTFESLAHAAEALRDLSAKLNSHKVYPDVFAKSKGSCWNAARELIDEMAIMKEDISKIINGTQLLLITTSKQFAEADEEAAQMIRNRVRPFETGIFT